ncbi:serine hydrolase domain-containing protein [Enterococcus canintestini]|uniref:serine hydrolase domain-containing protein n=1 Tax=Enterococcus canintestini TaxID=317010 RepID=UPI002890918A|nr:serine hydrolase domain-containing protein [Enterococcus canintestini]MDT2740243.1 serine hydrolase [Enterococcus canintestini]
MYAKTKACIKEQLAAGIFPGAAFAFIEKETVDETIVGAQMIVPHKVPLQKDTLFDVASLTKVICTTSVVLRLNQQGIIQLDQPLQKYLPAFRNPQITLRHLLTHTSDIKTWIANRDKLNKEELKAAYLKLQPGENLGKVVQYTDAGTILLGFMLEEIYQKTTIEIFRTEVLEPLKMNDSLFLPSEALRSKIAPTEVLPDGTVLQGLTHDPKARVLQAEAGNAGLFTNLSDLEIFAQMYLNWGQDYLREETVAMLLTDQTPTHTNKRSLGWDLKYTVDDKCRPLLFHTGYTGTFMLLDPENKSGFIFLSNRVHPIDNRQLYLKKRDEILALYLKEKAHKT